MADLVIPDFDFSGIYYGQILEGLIRYKRNNVPEISTENPLDPAIQLIRMFAYIGHLNNTYLDLTALECYIPTQQLRGNTVRSFALIGFRPKADIPATTILRAKLSQTIAVQTTVIPALSLFGTRRRGLTDAIFFEAQSAVVVDPTDVLTGCHAHDGDLDVWVDHTSAANTDVDPKVTFDAEPNNFLYLGHSDVFPDRIKFTDPTSFDIGDNQPSNGSDDAAAIHLQYYDGEKEDATPSSVTLQATTMTFVVNTLFSNNLVPQIGNAVWVTLNLTGASQRASVQWTSATGNFVVITGFLGQTVPSVIATNYTVGSYWHNVSLATNTTVLPVEVTRELVHTLPGAWVLVTLPAILERFPLDPNSIVTWYYLSGAIERVATFNLATGEVGGDAGPQTTVNPTLGLTVLEPISTPDALSTFHVTYFRESQWFQKTGEVTFLPPFDINTRIRDAQLPTEIRGANGPTDSLYWFRLLVSATGFVSMGGDPVLDFEMQRITIDSGNLYIQIPVTQGQTTVEVLGSGTGEAFQEFSLSSSPVVEDSIKLNVDNEDWVDVESFFAATAFDENYLVEIDGDGIGLIKTGDGINGRAVPEGVLNVAATYRINANEDGNVGPNTVVMSRSGASTVRNVTNPQAAFGWARQQGADPFALEQLKREGTAYLRTLRRGVSPYDIEYLTTQWIYLASKPFSRARAIENGFGRKTIKLIVVPSGGGTSTVATRVALNNYFNGDLAQGGVEPGVGLSNREVRSVDYSDRTFDIDATITGGNETIIRAFLRNALHPEALRDGVNVRWRFGQLIPLVILGALIREADSLVENIVFTQPVADIQLLENELPQIVNIALTFTV